ncbi:MAG: MFS transporter [Pseudomonadota bacterium]
MSSTIERLTGLHWRGQGPAFLVASGHAGTHWVLGTFYVLLPFIAREFGMIYTQAGALVTVFHVSSLLANLGSGAVVDMRGRRVLVQACSLIVGAAALMAMGLVTSAIWLVPLVVLIGVTNNLWHPAAISYLSQCFPQNRGYALAIHTLGASVGDAVAPVVAGSALLIMSWQATAGVVSIPVLIVAALILFTLNSADKASDAKSEQNGGFRGYIKGVGGLLRDRAVIGLCTMAAFRSMTQNGLQVFLPLYLVNVLKVSPSILGLAIMSMQVGAMLGGPVAGVMSDRIGRQPVTLICVTASTIVIIGLTLVDGMVLFILAASLLGLALFAVRPVIHSWAMDLAPPSMSGSIISLLFGAQSALSALVPLVGGMIADRWGLASVFYVFAGTLMIANVIVLFLPNHSAKRTDASG